ncbi:MAG: YggS family pyridoxal phosphate-dependent enzyme [Elusimicrobiota bacterium]
MNNIKNNLRNINIRINAATEKVGRKPDTVKLVVVTKTVGIDEIQVTAETCPEIKYFAENRVKQAVERVDVLNDYFAKQGLSWHFIGHLQTNKVKYVVGRFELIQSVDSERLIRAISEHAVKKGIIQKCLLELKISEEESKNGLDEKGLIELLPKISGIPGISILGLMTMAPFFDNPENTRTYFQYAKGVFDRLKNVYTLQFPGFDILSMGMSNDYTVAVEEGSTMVRLGTAVYGEKN